MLTETRTSRPSRVRILTSSSRCSSPWSMLFRRKHECSQWVARKTRAQRLPMTSLRDQPVMRSAARLNEVIRPSWSTVKMPSGMLSKMIEPIRGSSWLGMG